MKGPVENEVKIRVESPSKARLLLRRSGFTIAVPRVFERNLVLDDTRDSLRERGMLLRVRSAGSVVTCTFKGPAKPGRHKRREEREFRAVDFDSCLAVFVSLGYREVFRYEKYRTEFARKDDEGRTEPGVATLDETPVGNYLELEGPAAWIDRTTRLLGFTRQAWITASYGELYREWCEAQQADAADMKFQRR